MTGLWVLMIGLLIVGVATLVALLKETDDE